MIGMQSRTCEKECDQISFFATEAFSGKSTANARKLDTAQEHNEVRSCSISLKDGLVVLAPSLPLSDLSEETL